MAGDEDISGIRRRDSPESSSFEVQHVVDEKNASGQYHSHPESKAQALEARLGKDAEAHVGPMDDVEYVMDKVQLMTVQGAEDILRTLLKEHEYDYNFPQKLREQIGVLLEGPTGKDSGSGDGDWATEMKTTAALNRYYSPYPEVRAVTTPEDDSETPCETIRAYFIGLVWAIIGQFTNSLFLSRFPTIGLGSAVVQILLYPCGMLLAWVLPDWGFSLRGGRRVSLNPGPWSYKEQMLATIMVNVSINSAYCFFNIQTQEEFYHDTWLTAEYKTLLLLSTQLLGLGFSGLLRRFVVYPVEAIWPTLLPTVALNRALLIREKKETIHGWSLTRYQVFFIFFFGMFVYFWIPGYLFPALSFFAWMTWIAPNNFALNAITGNFGIGFNPIPTFDWNVVAGNGPPLAIPFYAFLQQAIGQFLAAFIVIGIYWTNKSWTAYLPINTPTLFDNTGLPYNISRVIDPNHAVVLEDNYKDYSPAFYSAGSLVTYGSFFMLYPVTMVFVLLDSWRPLWKAFRSMAKAGKETVVGTARGTAKIVMALARGQGRQAAKHVYEMFSSDGSIYDEFDDPLTQLMRKYPEVPDWWFFVIALVAFVFAIVIFEKYPQLDTPIWTIFFIIALNLVFLIPMSYINAISGITIGLNGIAELVIGYALPGRPEALMLIKAYGFNIDGQADNYISDQKIGFYAKLPPRAMYRVQVLSTILTTFVCYGVVTFVDSNIPGICTPEQKSHFTCRAGSAVFFSSSVVWGAIGPERVFSQLYPAMKYCFLIGFLLSLVWWACKRFGSAGRAALAKVLPSIIFKPIDYVLLRPLSWFKYVHPVLLITGASAWGANNLSFMTVGVYFSFGFMYYLRRYKTAWWEKYTYVISAALSGGIAFSGIIIFFALQWKPVDFTWWGTDIIAETIDGGAGQTALLPIPEKGHFGPDTWY